MQIYSTHKYKLKLTKTQKERVDSWIGACRMVYNLALETKIEAYKKGVSLSCYDLQKQLPSLRKEIDWIKDVPAQSLRDPIKRLDVAYRKFFKGGGFPKWAKKGRYKSISFNETISCFDNNTFILPKLKKVKIFKDRLPKGKIKTATITKEINGYFLCVTFETESENKYPTDENQVVGIDAGIKYFCIDSNGNFIENPRITKKYEKQLRIANRSLARKKKGSSNWKKQAKVVSKLHSKIARVRKDFLHKVSLQYVKEYSLIVCEDLKVKNLSQNNKLAKYISDVSWGTFFRMLKYKSEKYEKEFIQVKPHYTSQTCSNCGYIDKGNRATQSKFKCKKCSFEVNADLNASLNILRLGQSHYAIT